MASTQTTTTTTAVTTATTTTTQPTTTPYGGTNSLEIRTFPWNVQGLGNVCLSKKHEYIQTPFNECLKIKDKNCCTGMLKSVKGLLIEILLYLLNNLTIDN